MIEVLALFGLISWWVWSILLIMTLSAIVLVENESFVLSGFIASMIMLIFALNVTSSVSELWGIIKNNIGQIVYYTILYFVIGGIYSIVKWFFKLYSLKRSIISYCKSKSIDQSQIAESQISTLMSYNSFQGNFPPSIHRNSDKISGWIALWPLSLPATILYEPLSFINNKVKEIAQKVMERLTTEMFKDITIK